MAIEKEVNFLISSAEIASEGAQGINEVRANADDAKQLANTWRMTIDSSGHRTEACQHSPQTSPGTRRVSLAESIRVGRGNLRQQRSLLCYQEGASLAATPGASAQEVASWWSSLSDDDKQWMIEQHPDVIGNLEGVDYTSRNQANRIMLPRLKKTGRG